MIVSKGKQNTVMVNKSLMVKDSQQWQTMITNNWRYSYVYWILSRNMPWFHFSRQTRGRRAPPVKVVAREQRYLTSCWFNAKEIPIHGDGTKLGIFEFLFHDFHNSVFCWVCTLHQNFNYNRPRTETNRNRVTIVTGTVLLLVNGECILVNELTRNGLWII